MQKVFSLLIRDIYGVDWWKLLRAKNLVQLSLQSIHVYMVPVRGIAAVPVCDNAVKRTVMVRNSSALSYEVKYLRILLRTSHESARGCVFFFLYLPIYITSRFNPLGSSATFCFRFVKKVQLFIFSIFVFIFELWKSYYANQLESYCIDQRTVFT
jgi:hypothetical protein